MNITITEPSHVTDSIEWLEKQEKIFKSKNLFSPINLLASIMKKYLVIYVHY
jgi:hypothetical protein